MKNVNTALTFHIEDFYIKCGQIFDFKQVYIFDNTLGKFTLSNNPIGVYSRRKFPKSPLAQLIRRLKYIIKQIFVD